MSFVKNSNRPFFRKFRKKRPRPMALVLTPNIITQTKYHQVLRFRATSALSCTIYNRSIQNLLWSCTTATTGSALIAAFKINRVKIVAIADGGSGVGFNTIAFTWSGGAFGTTRETVAEGSAAIAGVIDQRPPRKSAADFWNEPTAASAGDTQFLISSLGSNVTVDVDVTYVLIDGAQVFTLACVAASPGSLYTNSLDNSTNTGAVGTNTLRPVGRFFFNAFG
jgi:hypothetical protein